MYATTHQTLQKGLGTAEIVEIAEGTKKPPGWHHSQHWQRIGCEDWCHRECKLHQDRMSKPLQWAKN